MGGFKNSGPLATVGAFTNNYFLMINLFFFVLFVKVHRLYLREFSFISFIFYTIASAEE